MRDVQKLQTSISKPLFLDRLFNEAAILVAAASFVALIVSTYGLDLSFGFF